MTNNDDLSSGNEHGANHERERSQELRHEVIADIERFIAPGGAPEKLIAHFRPDIHDAVGLPERMAIFKEVCEVNFDFRIADDGTMRERFHPDVEAELSKPREEVGEELWDLTYEVCNDPEVRMVESTELKDGSRVKKIGVAGALSHGIRTRIEYGATQLTEHDVTTKGIDLLMSGRILDPKDKEFFARFMPEFEITDTTTEADASVAIAQKLYGIQETGREQKRLGEITHYSPIEINGKTIPVRLLTAHPTGGRDRATSLDTFAFWYEEVELEEGDELAVTSTARYRLFQQFNGDEQALKKGSDVRLHVIGYEDPNMGFTANRWLQEFKAGVDSMVRIVEDYLKDLDTKAVAATPETTGTAETGEAEPFVWPTWYSF